MNWTIERVERLTTMWAEGLSGGQIAAELGDVSRNAVIGKAHRLKLAKRMNVAMPRAKPEPRIHKRQRFREVKPLFEELRDNPPTVDEAKLIAELCAQPNEIQGCTLMELTEKTCRWPLWDDVVSDQYCGAKPVVGSSYCPVHSKKAWRR